MTKTKKSFMFNCFAAGWALGIAFCSVCSGFIICGLICLSLGLMNIPFIIKNYEKLK